MHPNEQPAAASNRLNNMSGSTDQNQPKCRAPEEEDDAASLYHALNLGMACYVPMTLKAIMELGVLEIIGNAGEGRQLSSAEIASKMSTGSNANAAVALDRMLRLLASHSVLTCSVVEGAEGRMESLYGLAPVCKLLSPRSSAGRNWVLTNLDKVFLDSWHELKSAVLDDVVPFTKVHGSSIFRYTETDPRFNSVMNQSMSCLSTFFMKKVLDTYTGFGGLQELVDVGGGIGASLRMIVSKFPHIRGINFDLPHVVSNALPIPGVEHVGGDMFVSIPSGGAIFLKWVLHDWSDEHCLKILKNCFEALPSSGKVIVFDFITPEVPDSSAATQCTFNLDVCMLAYTEGGKERTKKEFELLATEAGFAQFNVACPIYNYWVMEFLK